MSDERKYKVGLIKFAASILVSWGISSCVTFSPLGWDNLQIPRHWMPEAFLSAFIGILVSLWINSRSFNKLRLLICLLASWGIALWVIKMGTAYWLYFFAHRLADSLEVMVRGSQIIVGTLVAAGLTFLLDALRRQQ